MSFTFSEQVISLSQSHEVSTPSGGVMPGSDGRPGLHPETGDEVEMEECMVGTEPSSKGKETTLVWVTWEQSE